MEPESDAANGSAAAHERPERDDATIVVGEARWPMAGAVLGAMALTILLPDDLRPGPRWLLPLIEGLLLVAVVAGDPGRITRRSRLRALSIVLVSVLVFNSLWATVLLIDHLIHGAQRRTQQAICSKPALSYRTTSRSRCSTGSWTEEAQRARPQPRGPRRLRFPTATEPKDRAAELAAPVHRLPVPGLHQRHRLQPDRRHAARPRAKIAMTVQSLISLAILGWSLHGP